MPVVRFLKVAVASRLGRRMKALETGEVRFRVWPGDLDVNRHMNNGRYLTLMDLGRFDLIGRLRFFPEMRRRRWFPVVASATIRFRRSLRLFQRFTIRTRVLGWDPRWIYLEQRFERGGELVATGLVKGVFRSKDGPIASSEVLAAMGVSEPSPELPPEVRLWQKMESSRPGGT